MARSFKTAVFKDSNKFMRNYSHRRLRRHTKAHIQRGDFDVMPLNRELTNQYDVCDWIIYPFDDWLCYSAYDKRKVFKMQGRWKIRK